MASSCRAFALALENGTGVGEERVVSSRVAHPRAVDDPIVARAESSKCREGRRTAPTKLARVIAARLGVVPPYEATRGEHCNGAAIQRMRGLRELPRRRELLGVAPRVG